MNPVESGNRAPTIPRTEELEKPTETLRRGSSSPQRRWFGLAAAIGGMFVLGIAAGQTWDRWLPPLRYSTEPKGSGPQHGAGTELDEHDQEGEAHASETGGHAGHDDKTSLELSEQGRKNVKLVLAAVELGDFARTIAVPAAFVERPGRTEIAVSAPMTGIVTRIYPLRGEAVVPGDPLFDLRLTHEDLVEKQSSLLRLLEELDVVKREVARLQRVTSSGVIAGKTLLERQYEQQKTEASLRAQKQALLLHSLTEEQIDSIEQTRRLLPSVTIFAPPMVECHSCDEHDEFLQVGALFAKLGEHVMTGMPLATLTDHCTLYIEGKAFEQDAAALNAAANAGTEVTALVEGDRSDKQEISGLRILYVENQVDRQSMALKFYVDLRNELVRNEQTADGHRFIGWRYKPGQRLEILVPVEQWKNRIILPVDAIVQEGAESYVYQQIAGHFDRKAVHVEYRDQRRAVLESDGTLFPGDVVAAKGAYQIHLALKNKSGNKADPHAGHNH